LPEGGDASAQRRTGIQVSLGCLSLANA